MRMWMVDPKVLCDKHLLGEHVEIHMFVGTVNRGISVGGFARNNLLQFRSLKSRHDELVVEMQARGFAHISLLMPVDPPRILTSEVTNSTVDVDAAAIELVGRCRECRRRFHEHGYFIQEVSA